MRALVRCPVCRESLSLPVDVEPYLTHGANGAKGMLTASIGVGGVEHTCGVPQEPTPVNTDLEQALERVLVEFNVPTYLVHGRDMSKATVGDRGDLSSDLATVARRHEAVLRDGVTIE